MDAKITLEEGGHLGFIVKTKVPLEYLEHPYLLITFQVLFNQDQLIYVWSNESMSIITGY